MSCMRGGFTKPLEPCNIVLYMTEHVNSGGNISRGRKVLFALVALVIAILLLEAFFRLFGLFEPERAFTVIHGPDSVRMVRYNLNDLNGPFPAEKGADTLRIMMFGGSTSLGFPFNPRSSFALRGRAMLERAFPGRNIELINLAKVGMNSTEVVRLMEMAVDYRPDLMLVYTGQNEFISLPRQGFRSLLSPSLGLSGSWFTEVRLVQAMSRLGKVAFGAAVISVMKGVDESPEISVDMPPSGKNDPDTYHETLNIFNTNLESILTLANDSGARLVLFTTASNLRGWPPDGRALPQGMDASRKRIAHRAISESGKYADKGYYGPALDMLRTQPSDIMQYAPLPYETGRLASEMIKIGAYGGSYGTSPELSREELKEIAVKYLIMAKDAEARTVISHRAPSDINDAIRKKAGESGAWLLDTEELLIGRSDLPPGFDRFVDHCHPGFDSQQIIAAALVDLVREKGFIAPEDAWPPLPAWNEEIWRESVGIDDEFLHGIYLRIGIFLGLEKDLPENSLATRKTLRRASRMGPEDPLPAVLEAVVALNYGMEEEAFAVLSPWYFKRRDTLEKCLGRYFTDRVALVGGSLMLKTGEEGGPPLRGLMKSGLFEEKEVPLKTDYNRTLEMERQE